MTDTFIIPRRFHAGYSWLGRAIRRHVEDDHYAEGVYILVLTSILIGLIMAFYLWWAMLQSSLQSGQTAIVYTGAQLGAAVLVFLTCVLGFKPPLRFICTPDALTIEHGKETLRVSIRSIYSVSSISVLDFHRHYRKYSQTRTFYNSLSHPLLLLKTTGGPIVLGLPEPFDETLRQLLVPDPRSTTVESKIFVV